MAKHLTDKDIENIVEILDEWPTDIKLTWDKLVDAVEQYLKFKTTRQTLEKQTRIKQAYIEVKAIVSGTAKPLITTTLPPSLKVAAERLENKDRKIERLERENQQLLEQFHVWLYNADRFGISISQLNEPLNTKEDK
jgi:hypothetical protein